MLREFKEMIEDNPRIFMYFSEMWDEIPSKPPYQNDPTGRSQIRNYHHMLQVLNHVFGDAPEWYVSGTASPFGSFMGANKWCQIGRMRLQALAWLVCPWRPSLTTPWEHRAAMRPSWTRMSIAC